MNVSRLRRPALVGPLLMMAAPFAWAQTADQAPTELDTVTVEAAPKAKKAKAKPKPTPAPQSASVPPPADGALDPTDLTLDGTVVTEGSGSYSAEASTIGGKLVLPLKETPRSISVLTRKRLDDENMTSIAQAAERATGVYVRNEGDVSDGPFFYARGFTMSVSENGVPFDTTFYGPGLDTAIYDRIEVLRGPDGLMQGQGQLGGSMNLVRKAPLAAPQVKTELVAGQWGNLRSVFDISTPAANGKIRTRVVGSAETRESFVDYVGQERYLGYGIVEIDVTERTTVTLSAMKQDNEVNPYFGALHVPGAIRDPNDPSAYIAAGEVESRGFEIEVAARPVKNWDIVAGYTYTETEFTAGQPAEIGQRFNSFFPKHSFKLWSNYTFDGGGLLDGVALGVGVRAFSESTAAFTSPYLAEVEQPAYAVVDGRLGYALTDSTELSLNVTNIFDEVYIPYPGVRAFYGEPRRALAKIVTTW